MDSILSRRAFGAGALLLWPARGAADGAPLPGFDPAKAGEDWQTYLTMLPLVMMHAGDILGLTVDAAERGCPGLRAWLAAWRGRPLPEILAALQAKCPEVYGPLASLAALDTALFGPAEFGAGEFGAAEFGAAELGPAVMPKGAVDIP